MYCRCKIPSQIAKSLKSVCNDIPLRQGCDPTIYYTMIDSKFLLNIIACPYFVYISLITCSLSLMWLEWRWLYTACRCCMNLSDCNSASAVFLALLMHTSPNLCIACFPLTSGLMVQLTCTGGFSLNATSLVVFLSATSTYRCRKINMYHPYI